MKVKGTRYERIEVEVDEETIRDIIREQTLPTTFLLRETHRTFCKKMTGCNESHIYIKDGQWCWEEECHGSHTFWMDRPIRDATPEEIEIMETFEKLKDLMVENKLING